MKLRFSILSSVAVVAVSHIAIAAQVSGPAQPGKSAGDVVIQIASVTQQIAQVASTVAVVGPPAASPEPAPQVAPAPVRTVAHKGSPQGAAAAVRPRVVKASRPQRVASDLKPIWIRCVGHSETGKAAWYGGRYVGRRTTSGGRLDTIHPTAAHRTLPLNSLALVTNLKNGRSVVVKVTDRGPLSDSLLIDMSPRAAEQLAMVDAGVVPVKVEQVVEVPPDSK